jgi:hypothetical protein
LVATKDKKERVNLTIDPILRAAFDSTHSIHGKTLSELLENAIENLLGDEAPDILLEIQIEQQERKLAEMKEGLIEAKYLAAKKQAERKVQKAKSEVRDELAEKLETFREKKYQQGKTSIAFQINKRTIDWNVIKDLFKFRDRLEAQDWIESKLEEEGLIESRFN